MKHIPNKLDITADLRRCIYSSYSDLEFEDENVELFLKSAEKNLETVKDQLEKNTFQLIKNRLKKAKSDECLVGERRENLLIASCLLY